MGAHAGICWSSHGHPLELTRASLGGHTVIPWSSRGHPLELHSNSDCAFLWWHHGLGPARGRTPLHSVSSLVGAIVAVLTWQGSPRAVPWSQSGTWPPGSVDADLGI